MGTLIRLLSCMCSQMSSQVEVKGKALTAVLAFVRTFACVHELMPAQLGVVEKLLTAAFMCAYELAFPVSSGMLAKRTWITKNLTAVFY